MNARRLFMASRIALVATAMSFAIRGDILPQLDSELSLGKEQLGLATGAWAYGFTLAIVCGGQLVDSFGMRRILYLAFVAHLLGILLTLFANGFGLLFAGTLGVGLGNGLIEAAVNPLTATLYPEDKTAKLNLLHVWFPGGIVIGGLIAFGMSALGLGWQAKMAVILVPVAIYGLMFRGQDFPATERVQRGVSTAAMYRELLRPLFLVIVFCMILTASTELAPNQWIPDILSRTIPGFESAGILFLVWINGLMAVGRLFAGPIVHRLSPVGLLIGSSICSALGLYLLSIASSPAVGVVAATLFAIGVCYYWPTMLGITAERFPAGGAVALAIVGGTGTLSVGLFTWFMGGIYESAGPRKALAYMAILPLMLCLIFGAIRLNDRSRSSTPLERLPLAR